MVPEGEESIMMKTEWQQVAGLVTGMVTCMVAGTVAGAGG